jgi:hypothetical protein
MDEQCHPVRASPNSTFLMTLEELGTIGVMAISTPDLRVELLVGTDVTAIPTPGAAISSPVRLSRG